MTRCDLCDAAPDPGCAWPICRDCGLTICLGCAEPKTLREADGATDSAWKVDTCVCVGCADDRAA